MKWCVWQWYGVVLDIHSVHRCGGEHDTMILTAGSVASGDTDNSDIGDMSPLTDGSDTDNMSPRTDNSDNDDTSPFLIQLTITTDHLSPTLVTVMTHHSR